MGTAVKAAEFITSEPVVTPVEIRPGEAVTITVDVTNTGEKEGSYSVVLKINGTVEATREITLAGSESTSVSFSVTKDTGSYEIEIDGQNVSFEVITPVQVVSWWIIFVIIAGVIIAGLLIFFLLWRRRRKREEEVPEEL